MTSEVSNCFQLRNLQLTCKWRLATAVPRRSIQHICFDGNVPAFLLHYYRNQTFFFKCTFVCAQCSSLCYHANKDSVLFITHLLKSHHC